MLNEELNKMRFMAKTKENNNNFSGGHSNRSKSTMIESPEKLERGQDDFLRVF